MADLAELIKRNPQVDAEALAELAKVLEALKKIPIDPPKGESRRAGRTRECYATPARPVAGRFPGCWTGRAQALLS